MNEIKILYPKIIVSGYCKALYFGQLLIKLTYYKFSEQSLMMTADCKTTLPRYRVSCSAKVQLFSCSYIFHAMYTTYGGLS